MVICFVLFLNLLNILAALGHQILEKSNEDLKNRLTQEFLKIKEGLEQKSEEEKQIALQEAIKKADFEKTNALDEANKLQVFIYP